MIGNYREFENMSKQQTYHTGDIFSVEITPDQFAFGLVRLDVYKQCIENVYICINDLKEPIS